MVQLFLITLLVMSPYLVLRGRALLRERRARRPTVDPPPEAGGSETTVHPDDLSLVISRIEAVGVDGGADDHEVIVPAAPLSFGRTLPAAIVDQLITDALDRSRVERVAVETRGDGSRRMTCRKIAGD